MNRNLHPRVRLATAATVLAASLSAATAADASAEPPGLRLAYASSDQRHIDVVDISTGDVRTVVTARNFHAVTDPSWSPRRGRLAYGDTLGAVEPVLGELRIIDLASYRTTTVLSLPTLFVHHVAWSPAGDRIAFATSTVFTPLWGLALSHESVHVVDVTGANHLVLGPGTDPAWSPDGARVAFASLGDILVVDPDDPAATHTVGLPTLVEASPRWSPDGARLAFTSSGLLGAPSVMVSRADGSELRTLPGVTWSPPTWSSDGRHVAYEDRGIVSVDVASVARRRVLFEEDGGARGPVWSSWGWIAFATDSTVDAIDARTLQRRVLARRSPSPRLAWTA